MTNDWQPIETAPKDGTPILVYSRSLTFVIVLYNGTQRKGASETAWETLWDCDRLASEPTHWMPLPSAPQIDEREAAEAIPASVRTDRGGLVIEEE